MQSSAKLTGAFSIVESLVAIWSVHSFSALINMGHAQLQSPGSRCVEQAARREGGRRTGASENLALRSPLGRPRWLQRTTRLPAFCRCLMVGKASSRRVVSVISPVFLSCTVRGREVHAQVQQRGRDNLRRARGAYLGNIEVDADEHTLVGQHGRWHIRERGLGNEHVSSQAPRDGAHRRQ